MKQFFLHITSAALIVAGSILFAPMAHAQFSHAVVVMTGTVISEENAKPTSVKVSIREAGDTAREITRSTSNSQTGKYLVVLQPGKKYWVHLEGDSIMTQDVLVTTPVIDRTEKLTQDFTVVMREVEAAKPSDAATKPSGVQMTN